MTTTLFAGRTADAAGTSALFRFALRRERRGLPWWLTGTAVLLGYQSWGSQSFYDSPAKLAQLRETMGGNAAMVAMAGPAELLTTIGGEVVFEIFAYLAVVVALMNMFLVGRCTRTDEDNGRAELVRSARVGRRAPLLAAVALAGFADVAVAIAVFGAAVVTGLPTGGSILLAASLAGVGIVFAGLTAVAAQVFENPRSVYGAVASTIGIAYALRAIGDVGDGTLSWLSPIGWGQRTFPFAGDRWWPLVLPTIAGAALVVGAVAILDRRDYGAGVFGSRSGRARASWALGSPLGLAWRLQRGALLMWIVGVFTLGAAYGSFGNSIEDFIADNPEIAAYLPGGAGDAVNAYLALTITMAVLLAAAYGISSALRVRGEESSGRAEPVFATPTGRTNWFASHIAVAFVGSAFVALAGGFGEGLAYGLTISDPGQAVRLAGVALVYLPAMWFVVAVAVLGVGYLPKLAAALAWAAFGYCVVVVMFADSFKLPDWVRSASPFTHTAQAPLENITAGATFAILALTVAVLVLGFAGFRNRDVGY
ncbi:ABC transporter permease [Antrihabitans sp. YC3-6]|uniref:ABC transporter permease n=1 Tax=Antrihabitans stalagmiti TaxID=2799499 RepID=A0A934NTZ7_9NOCA|nr:ABC transporter permease [Antrihabitans stalagmiti]MBJ8341258.1 ABC transporter permease [Antrihabitans stalagmiti]